MRVLITGFTGFVGSHLAEYLVARGDVEVFGMHRWRSRLENVQHLGDQVRLVECDLRDPAAVRRMLRDVRPDRIFHLAAQSYVPTSWLTPSETLSVNVLGQVNLFEAMRDLDLPARVHIAGSSEEYGLVLPDEVPIREDSPLRPLSPYAVSKVTQDLLAYQYWRSYQLHVVRTRGFNHTGPRRGEVFVTSNFSRQVAEIEKGSASPSSRWAISSRSATSRTCATWCGPTGWPSSAGSPERSTTSARAAATPRGRCWTSSSTWPT